MPIWRKTTKARKDYECDLCNEVISAGTKYETVSAVGGGVERWVDEDGVMWEQDVYEDSWRRHRFHESCVEFQQYMDDYPIRDYDEMMAFLTEFRATGKVRAVSEPREWIILEDGTIMGSELPEQDTL